MPQSARKARAVQIEPKRKNKAPKKERKKENAESVGKIGSRKSEVCWKRLDL